MWASLFNNRIQKNKIDYQDNLTDYSSPSEIGGADVYFVDTFLSYFQPVNNVARSCQECQENNNIARSCREFHRKR